MGKETKRPFPYLKEFNLIFLQASVRVYERYSDCFEGFHVLFNEGEIRSDEGSELGTELEFTWNRCLGDFNVNVQLRYTDSYGEDQAIVYSVTSVEQLITMSTSKEIGIDILTAHVMRSIDKIFAKYKEDIK